MQWFVMDGFQHSTSHYQADSKVRIEQTYLLSSLEETNSFLKTVFFPVKTANSLPGLLVSVQLSPQHSQNFQVKLVTEPLDNSEVRRIDTSAIASGLNADFHLGKCLYTSQSSIVKVEVFEAKTGLSERSVVVKRYHCGPKNLNAVLEEALLQRNVESLHVCRLLDITLSKGSSTLYEVSLALERLEGDLESSLRERKASRTLYTEQELCKILENVSDALFFAQLQVSCYLGSGS